MNPTTRKRGELAALVKSAMSEQVWKTSKGISNEIGETRSRVSDVLATFVYHYHIAEVKVLDSPHNSGCKKVYRLLPIENQIAVCRKVWVWQCPVCNKKHEKGVRGLKRLRQYVRCNECNLFFKTKQLGDEA